MINGIGPAMMVYPISDEADGGVEDGVSGGGDVMEGGKRCYLSNCSTFSANRKSLSVIPPTS